MAIKYENILRVLDIDHRELPRKFMDFMVKQTPSYYDQVLAEHLYSPDDLTEQRSDLPPGVMDTLEQIAALLQQTECSYFRIIYP